MKRTISVSHFEDPSSREFLLKIPTRCPVCGTAYSSAPVSSVYAPYEKTPDIDLKLSATYHCPHCENFFTATYSIPWDDVDTGVPESFMDALFPVPTRTTEFSQELSDLSPDFVELYHQAEKAESFGLSKIIGISYRKSLEFLVKDYAIRFFPDDEESIKSVPLSACINNYIDDPRIKDVATASAWIGNDETHYVRKHADRDIHDLKNFIIATERYIEIALIAEDAKKLTSKH